MSAIGGPIRDKLPQKLAEEGFTCQVRQASGRELSGVLGKGLSEATQNFLQAPSAEAAAEISDLLAAACKHHQISPEQMQQAQQELREAEGSYSDLILEALRHSG